MWQVAAAGGRPRSSCSAAAGRRCGRASRWTCSLSPSSSSTASLAAGHAFGESYERDFNIMQVPSLPSAGMTSEISIGLHGWGAACWEAVHYFTDATMAAARLAA